MSLPIPEKFHDLLTRPLLCGLTTLNPDGQPHSVPVWFDYDGTHIRINAPAATKKARNLEKDSRLVLLVLSPENPGHWIEVQGRVSEVRDHDQGAWEHINKLSERYTGNPVYQGWGNSAQNRRMYIIEAVKINGN